MLNENLKHEMLKSIDITKQAAKNNLEVNLECYTEILTRLDLLVYILVNLDKK